MTLFRRVLTYLIVSLWLVAFLGCGVSKEEHEKTVSELKNTKMALEKAMADLDRNKTDLTQAKTKMASLEKSLAESQAQIKIASEKTALENKNRESNKAMLDKLAASQKEAQELRVMVKNLTGENTDLKSMIDKLKTEYAEIQKKLGGGMESSAPQLPVGLPKMP